MKKILYFFFSSLLIQPAFSQKNTFDIVRFTPPKNWQQQLKPELIIFTNVNDAKGVYCMIAMYNNSRSTGKPDKDFISEWNTRTNAFGSIAVPKTEIETNPDGWTVITGAAPIVHEKATSYLVLTVFSGFGKTVSVLANLNDEGYVPEIDAFLTSMKIDKTATAVTTNTKPSMQTNTSTKKFRQMLYSAPAGWSEEVFQDGVVFKPLDLPAGEHLAIQIMEPLTFGGTIEQALSQSYDEAALTYKSTKMHYAGGANYQKTEPQRSFNGWEYIQGKGGVQVENGTPYKTELGLDLFVIRINNRYERIAVLKSRTNCNLSRYYSTDRRTYMNAIDNFYFSLQFTDGGQPVVKAGSIHGDNIVGLWQGISLSVGPSTSTERLGVRYKVFSPIFFSNGQAYFGPKFPTEGLDEFNSRIPAELYRRDWGTYTFINGRGILKMPYADIPIRMENNRLIISPNKTDHAFARLPSVDGAKFHGTYLLSEVNGKIPTITFFSDGRFTDNGAMKVLYHEYIDCINPGVLPGSGTYEVKNYSIFFRYTDGRNIKIAFPGAEYDIKNHSPASLLLSFNEDRLTRQ